MKTINYFILFSIIIILNQINPALKASLDALHIAMVAHHEIDYLLTWNCKHIANARILPGIYQVLTDMECTIPIICTPEEMVDDDSEDK